MKYLKANLRQFRSHGIIAKYRLGNVVVTD